MSRPLILTLALSCVLCLLGCQKDSPKSKTIGTVKIGAIYPFTGNSGSAGLDIKDAVQLAEEIINGSYDMAMPLAKEAGLSSLGGAKVKVVYRDSQGDDKKTPDLVEKLVTNEQVKAVMGCYNSGVTATASEQAEVMRIPFVNPESTSPVLTRRGLKWFFRTTPDDAMFVENLFAFLSELPQPMQANTPKRLTLVYENQLWGTGVARVERKLSTKYGYEIAEDITYDAKGNQFDEELRRIKLSLPSVIMQSSYAKDAVTFMKGYKAQQINPVAILAMNAGFISPTFLESLGADGEYVLSREVWALDGGNKKPLVKTVNDLFKNRYHRNMTGNSARAFTGLIVLADAINRAGTTDPQKIREALIRTNISGDALIMPWDGVNFDPDTGQNVLGKGLIVQVQQGRYVTVWPKALSTNPIIWPMPSWSERNPKK